MGGLSYGFSDLKTPDPAPRSNHGSMQGYRARTIGLALVAHTGFGLYVVLVKYLLRYLPPFGLLAVAFGIAVPVTFFVARPTLGWRDFCCAQIWLLLGIVVVRSVSKLLALQFTLATYVQLIDLSVPFFTPIVARMLLREAAPSRTLAALAAISFGSFLVVTVDPFDVQLPNGHSDLVGIALALTTSLAMALGVVYTRYLTTRRRLNPASVFFQQIMAVAITYGVLSALTGESWQPFAALTVSDWIIYVLFVLVAIIGAGLAQVLSISRINATLFSTLLSWRLMVALGAGWALLGERLTSVWQGIGAVVVILAITLYLQHQATSHAYMKVQKLNEY